MTTPITPTAAISGYRAEDKKLHRGFGGGIVARVGHQCEGAQSGEQNAQHQQHGVTGTGQHQRTQRHQTDENIDRAFPVAAAEFCARQQDGQRGCG